MKELNKQVKALYKRTVFNQMTPRIIEAEIKPEYLRLYEIDPGFEQFNRDAVLIMFVINQRFGFVNRMRLYSNINQTKLLKI